MVLSFNPMNGKNSRMMNTGLNCARRSYRAPNNRRQSGRNRLWPVRMFGLALLLVLARPADAHAYVDPSSASYFFQWLLAGLLGAAFAVRMFWQNIKAFFSKSSSKGKKAGSDTDISNQ